MRQFSAKGEISTDGRNVWINDAKGCSIGRFTRRMYEVTKLDGVYDGEAFDGLLLETKWDAFKQSMLTYHDFKVPDLFMPAPVPGFAS